MFGWSIIVQVLFNNNNEEKKIYRKMCSDFFLLTRSAIFFFLKSGWNDSVLVLECVVLSSLSANYMLVHNVEIRLFRWSLKMVATFAIARRLIGKRILLWSLMLLIELCVLNTVSCFRSRFLFLCQMVYNSFVQ